MAKDIYDLYGCDIEDLELARAWVEAALGVTLVGRETLYRGGRYYRWDGPEGDALILQMNSDGGEPVYPKNQLNNPRILLYVNKPRDADKIRSALMSAGKFLLLERGDL